MRDPNGVELARHDNIDEEATTNARVANLELPADGVYEIEVRGVAYLTGGAYTLIIQRGENSTD